MKSISRVIIAALLTSVFIFGCSEKKDVTKPKVEEETPENNGLLAFELEELDYGSGWRPEVSIAGFSGAGYLRWTGSNNFGNPGQGLINITLDIQMPGKYRIQWHSKVGHGTNSTESNDSWLRCPNASNFYGEKNGGGSKVYPHGSGKTPTPNGAGKDGWFKIYSSGTTDWTWSSQTSDHDAHQIYAEFDEAGEYLLQISGRSKDHLLDRIIIYHSSVNGNVARLIPSPELYPGG